MEEQNTTPVPTGGPTANMIARDMVAGLFAQHNGASQAPAFVAPNPTVPTQDTNVPAPAAATGSAPVPSPTTTEATPPVPPPADEGQQALSTEDKKAHAFAELRFANKQLTQRTADLEKQIEALNVSVEEANKKASEYESQLAESSRVRADLEDRVGRASLAESKEFRERYDAKIDTTLESLTKVITENTTLKDPKKASDYAASLLNSSKEDMVAAVQGLPTYVQGSIYNLVDEGKRVQAEREDALTQWRATQTGLSEAEARRQAEQMSQRRAMLSEQAMEAVRTSTMPAYALTDPDFVNARKQAEEKATAFLRTAPEEDIVKAAAEGMMAHLNYAIIDALQEQVVDLQQKLAAGHRLSSPPVRSVAPAQPPAPVAPTPTPTAHRTTHTMATDIVAGLFAKRPR